MARLPIVGLLLLLGSAEHLMARSASGDEPPRFLSWDAPPTCPTGADVARQVVGAVGATVLPRDLRVGAVVREAPDGWTARLDLSLAGQHSERVIRGETCQAVADACAVIVALAVNPAGPEPPAPPPLPGPPPPPPPPPLPLPSYRWTLGAALLLDAGTLASVDGGAELAFGWRSGRVELELGARFLAPEKTELPTLPSQGAHFTVVGIGGRACYAALVTGRVDFDPCVGVGGDWLVASGFGTNNNRTAASGSPVLGLGARVTARLGARWALRAGLEVAAPLLRVPFEIDNPPPGTGGDVYRRSAVAGRAVVGPLLTF